MPPSEKPAPRRPRAPRAPFDREAALRSLLERLEAGEAPAWGKVPPAERKALAELLHARGYETTSKGVRVPPARQLLALLEEGHVLPLRGLASRLTGVAARDAERAAKALVREGQASLAVRKATALLVGRATPVLTAGQLDALRRSVAELVPLLKTVTKHRAAQGTLLREDVLALLPDLGPLAQPRPPDVLDTVRRLEDPSLGMAFVPAVVRALGPALDTAQAHAALLSAARSGQLELRPESGMGRVAPDDGALALPGPQGSLLTWARLT